MNDKGRYRAAKTASDMNVALSHRRYFQWQVVVYWKRNYAGGKLLKYSEIAEESVAIGWYKKQNCSSSGYLTRASEVQPQPGAPGGLVIAK